ncbi:MAG: TIGR03943 family protein, partial [Cyanobium sp. MAG_102]|nr:TIGR03943 family protein [Cyanobium sp. MAG_185]MDP4946848.1 TIGR03943 family protein [Cyanobium sp. MAG_102]
MRAFALGLWGAVLLQSSLSGRLDLLLSGVFHPLVALSGVALLLLAGLLLAELALRGQESPAPSRRQAIPKIW